MKESPYTLTRRQLLRTAALFLGISAVPHSLMRFEAYTRNVESVGAVFLREFKEMALIGYYTSEVGARVELAYSPVPGEYDGCVPLSKSGRAWATNGFPTSRIKVTHA